MIYQEYKPHPCLSGYIECYWSAYAERPPFREQETLIPDGTIELMFNFGDDYFQVMDGKKQLIQGSHIIGIRREALRISQTKKQNFFCIRFRPGGMYPFFRIPAHLYANNFFNLEDIIGPEYALLEERLYETLDDNMRVRIIERYLIDKLGDRVADHGFVIRCLSLLEQIHSPRINGLASHFNTNYKTLERKFNSVVGLSPSLFLKIRRFNKVLLAIYSCKHNSLAEAALECGYYDQSHFNREFRQLTGYSPGVFLKEQFTIVEVIQPALAKKLSNSYKL